MLSYLKWSFWIVFWTVLLAFLHYTLPQWDVVRIADTYETRVNPGENAFFWSDANTGNLPGSEAGRDVFFIQALRPGGDPAVYRNEDTGWGWPPYFKFDTTNLQTQAADLRSSSEQPRWVAIKHYGWRSELFTVFPNAIRIKEVAGPDARVIPWVSIVLLVALACVFWAIWARWRKFRENRVDPWLDDVV